MSKRTNKLYNVTVCRYASITVEADSPREAMEIASEADLEECIDNEAFMGSDIEVESSETSSYGIDDFLSSEDEIILTKDGVLKVEEYREQLKTN